MQPSFDTILDYSRRTISMKYKVALLKQQSIVVLSFTNRMKNLQQNMGI